MVSAGVVGGRAGGVGRSSDGVEVSVPARRGGRPRPPRVVLRALHTLLVADRPPSVKVSLTAVLRRSYVTGVTRSSGDCRRWWSVRVCNWRQRFLVNEPRKFLVSTFQRSSECSRLMKSAEGIPSCRAAACLVAADAKCRIDAGHSR